MIVSKIIFINSMTNSTYALVWNTQKLKDLESHWAEAAVNDLALRLIVSGIDQERFSPDAAITRAEFAAIVARALGLPVDSSQQGDVVAFNDVKRDAWYFGAVMTAKEYGILSGYDDNTFRPNHAISRQEAMVMIAKAMKIAGFDVEIESAEVSRLLASFKDGQNVVRWAQSAVAATVKHGLVSGANGELRPDHEITRAETASIVQRLLRQAGLID